MTTKLPRKDRYTDHSLKGKPKPNPSHTDFESFWRRDTKRKREPTDLTITTTTTTATTSPKKLSKTPQYNHKIKTLELPQTPPPTAPSDTTTSGSPTLLDAPEAPGFTHHNNISSLPNNPNTVQNSQSSVQTITLLLPETPMIETQTLRLEESTPSDNTNNNNPKKTTASSSSSESSEETELDHPPTPPLKKQESIIDLTRQNSLSSQDIISIVNSQETPPTDQTTTKEKNSNEKKSKKQKLKPSKILFNYPPNAKDAITINEQDIIRLAPDNLLNDSIIDFYLRYYKENKMKKKYRSKFHIFNSFFYLSLKKDSIGKWTRDIDIFEKDFLVIPINQHYHWKLAIIAYPGKQYPLKPTSSDNMDRPCILLFDSLGLESEYSPIFENLRSYLEKEHSEKKKETRRFNKTNMCGIIPKVPIQVNYTDCGLFVINYLKKFTESLPINFTSESTIEEKIKKNWFPVDEISKLREDIKDAIKEVTPSD